MVGLLVFKTRFITRAAKLLVEGNAAFVPSAAIPSTCPAFVGHASLLMVGEDNQFVRDIKEAYKKDKDCVAIIQGLRRQDEGHREKYEIRDGLLVVKSDDAVSLLRIPQVDTILLRLMHDFHDAALTSGSPVENLTRSRQETIELAQRNLKLAQERQAKYYNRGRQQVSFEVGDLVYVDSRVLNSELGQPDYDPERDPACNKLLPKWYGPFSGEQRIGENAYRVALPHRYVARGRHATFNVDQLKLSHDVPEIFRGRQITKSAPRMYDSGGERVYVIQELLEKRRRRGRLQYLCSWVDLPDNENSWDFEEDIKHVSH
ncbi:unnamed protein product [Phytophthora lilii]|uniref:Unnamed protein product n=1 Tax=Phytophthora lilii TaxID=2077276 RepID=A0A9W6YID2_9STRA|nr:unnamed protein product [Phytophthora lilii]